MSDPSLVATESAAPASKRDWNPRVFWPLAVIGWGVMAFGLLALIHKAASTHPVVFGVWFLGGALVHDFVIAPFVFVLGLRVRRLVSSRIRAVVQAGLIVSGLIVLVALPVVSGRGGVRGNPSALPNNYGFGLLVVLAAIWAVTTAGIVVAWRRSRA